MWWKHSVFTSRFQGWICSALSKQEFWSLCRNHWGFFWQALCRMLNHMMFIFPSGLWDYLWTTWSSYTRLVKKMQAMLCWLFLLLLLLFTKRVIKSLINCEAPLQCSPVELGDETQLCLQEGVAIPSVPSLPRRNLLPGGWHRSSPCCGWGVSGASSGIQDRQHTEGTYLNQPSRNTERQMFISPSVWSDSDMRRSNQWYLWAHSSKPALKLDSKVLVSKMR